jgi:hypothetical protein
MVWVVSLDMIRTSSVIKDGALVKSHTDYPVTNKTWKLMGIELSVYLDSLNLTDPTNSIFENYNDIWNWYLRSPHRNESNLDPWNRLFVCYPPDKTHYQDDLYKYQILTHDNFCVCIVVTTVNGMKVYCVDIIL